MVNVRASIVCSLSSLCAFHFRHFFRKKGVSLKMHETEDQWAVTRGNLYYNICIKRLLRSFCTSTQSDRSLWFLHGVTVDPISDGFCHTEHINILIDVFTGLWTPEGGFFVMRWNRIKDCLFLIFASLCSNRTWFRKETSYPISFCNLHFFLQILIWIYKLSCHFHQHTNLRS